jgi:hypothetical protein
MAVDGVPHPNPFQVRSETSSNGALVVGTTADDEVVAQV